MPLRIGYQLSSEEHRPADLVRYARLAEEHGFDYATISDPAIVAQASATVAAMMPGRFFLGVGTGENLNEHILGDAWPETEVRQARLYTRPDEPPPLLIATGPEAEMLRTFDAAGGRGKPRYGSVTVCRGKSEASARKTAHRMWPTAAMESSLSWELPLPRHFEDIAKLVTEDAVAEEIVCGPDPERHAAAIATYVEAGFDHVAAHQVGPDQQGFFAFFAREVLPRVRKLHGTGRVKRLARARSRRRAA